MPVGEMVAPLAAFGREDLAVAGGKAANLGELLRGGFAVPPGFVITTAAYERFVADGRLDGEMQPALAGLDVADGAALERASHQIQQAFAGAALPEDVAGAIRGAYRALGESEEQTPLGNRGGAAAVAVRSSATTEDLPGASFAGQQETYLNVRGEDALLDAVRRCWASLWSPRSLAYRQRQDIDHRTVQLAVVVQRLVDAEVAGVLFTANPITGARDELVIDASPGLGEAVVSGVVTPDHYVLQKGTHTIVERQIGRREVVIRPAAGGGTEQTSGALPLSEAAEPALSDAALDEIARIGEAIERQYGAPQDVEWAWAGGQCYVLQARPVTALPPAPAAQATRLTRPTESVRAAAPARRRRGRDPNLAGELFPLRPYPLDVTAHTRVMLRAVGKAMATPLGLQFPTVEDSIEVQDGVPIRLTGFQPRPTWRVAYKPWLSIWQRRRYDPTHWRDDPLLHEPLAHARSLAARDLRPLSWDEVVATLHEVLDLVPALALVRERYFPLAVRDTALLWLLLRLAGEQRRFGDLVSGVETKTLEANRALQRLAELVRANPALRRLFAEHEAADLPAALAAAASQAEPEVAAFQGAFDTFLREYGHRESAITLFSQPSWQERSAVPLGIVKALVVAPPVIRDRGRAASWERARDAVLAQSILGRSPLRGLFLRLLDQARLFPQLREDTHFYLTVPLPLERRSALELGRRLVEAGVIDTPDDVFHFTLSELAAAGRPWPPREQIETLRGLVGRRRAAREALANQPFADPHLSEVPAVAAADPEALLTGTPGSAGVAEGPVRIVRSPAEFAKLQPGDVLVAPFTNPSWTPLFALVAAVVVDTGGAISHAAIVAREYGVPAVMGTRVATARLADGQRVRVDGTRGRVVAAEPGGLLH